MRTSTSRGQNAALEKVLTGNFIFRSSDRLEGSQLARINLKTQNFMARKIFQHRDKPNKGR